MKKVISVFFYLLVILFGLNGLYIFIFTTNSDYFRVFGMFETNKFTAAFIYLAFSFLLFISMKFEKKE